MQVVLVMFTADGARRSFALNRDVTVIGRREDCDLRIPLTEVSRKHCRVVKDSHGIRIEDLGSSNGTYHNGARIQESNIEPGDQLQIGPVTFIAQVDGFPPDDALRPPQPEAAAEGSPTEAQADDSASGATARVEPTPAAKSLGNRPAAPQGDEFVISDDARGHEEDDDVVDMNTIISPKEDDEK